MIVNRSSSRNRVEGEGRTWVVVGSRNSCDHMCSFSFVFLTCGSLLPPATLSSFPSALPFAHPFHFSPLSPPPSGSHSPPLFFFFFLIQVISFFILYYHYYNFNLRERVRDTLRKEREVRVALYNHNQGVLGSQSTKLVGTASLALTFPELITII